MRLIEKFQYLKNKSIKNLINIRKINEKNDKAAKIETIQKKTNNFIKPKYARSNNSYTKQKINFPPILQSYAKYFITREAHTAFRHSALRFGSNSQLLHKQQIKKRRKKTQPKTQFISSCSNAELARACAHGTGSECIAMARRGENDANN